MIQRKKEKERKKERKEGRKTERKTNVDKVCCETISDPILTAVLDHFLPTFGWSRDEAESFDDFVPPPHRRPKAPRYASSTREKSQVVVMPKLQLLPPRIVRMRQGSAAPAVGTAAPAMPALDGPPLVCQVLCIESTRTERERESVCVYVYVCMCMCVCVCVYVCKCVCVYMYICVCVYARA